jgi:hypothetical protein
MGVALGDSVAEPAARAEEGGAAEAAAPADAPADALGPAEMLGDGLGTGDGKRVVGTLARERAKIRMKMTRTISTHGRASESVRGGSAPR